MAGIDNPAVTRLFGQLSGPFLEALQDARLALASVIEDSEPTPVKGSVEVYAGHSPLAHRCYLPCLCTQRLDLELGSLPAAPSRPTSLSRRRAAAAELVLLIPRGHTADSVVRPEVVQSGV